MEKWIYFNFYFLFHYFFYPSLRNSNKKENQYGTFPVVKQGEVSKKGFYVLLTYSLDCQIYHICLHLWQVFWASFVASYLCQQLQDARSVLSYKNCYNWSQNMTFLTVQTVFSTFLSHDRMILGNVGISPRPSICLTRNNAQRRWVLIGSLTGAICKFLVRWIH